MRILYVASAIEAGGSSGGWTHVSEVACGLRDLGHQVLVVARRGDTSHLACGAPLVTTRLPQYAAMLAAPRMARIISKFRPDAIMERFYNFAGAGVLTARLRRVPVLLEVNAPMVDPPGSLKTRIDRYLLGSMRRWAVKQAKWSAAIVTPLASTVPPEVSRRKIHELPWGANVEHFDPSLRTRDFARVLALKEELGLDTSVPVAVFLGSFRAWHGVGHFVEAARRLLQSGKEVAFLAIGGGPELEPLKGQVLSWGLPADRFVFTGPQPHERIPELLAVADIGVAPFDPASYPPLTTFGFYWSPLKVFEYMAMALPVVTIDVTPLNEIVRDGREGLLYRPGAIPDLAGAIDRLASEADLRRSLGESARERVTIGYSWQAHCRSLDTILRGIVHAS